METDLVKEHLNRLDTFSQDSSIWNTTQVGPEMLPFLLLCLMPGVLVRAWEENSIMFLGQSIASAGNLTNCWVCIHGPTHPAIGIPMHGVPIPLKDWGNSTNTSFVRFSSHSNRTQQSIPEWLKKKKKKDSRQVETVL
uniref:Uncharacterized protein n=1 Tax=Crocodylus porosus TaxID=8502 RepID=A0A7M4EZW8_CROPO